MNWPKLFKGGLSTFVMLSLVFQLAACGTLMYPERKGQKAGKIDPNVAILDGLGLLLFIIPGVIAFAVDFSNGTIYLPGTASVNGVDNQFNEWTAFTIPSDNLTRGGVEAIIAAQTDVQDALSSSKSSVYEVSGLSEAKQKLAYLSY